MQTKSPFLTGFSAQLCGRAKRSAQVKIRLERQRLNEECIVGVSQHLRSLVSQFVDRPQDLCKTLSFSIPSRFIPALSLSTSSFICVAIC